MWFQVRSYISHRLKATNQHGVHSPFVFNFLTQCLYDKRNYPEYDLIKAYRNELFRDKTVISVTDHGAGSRLFKSAKRKRSDIARHAGSSLKESKTLFRIASYFKPITVIELGTSMGLGSLALSLGNNDSNIISVEGCEATLDSAILYNNKYDLKNIRHVNATFDDFLDGYKGSIDLAYIDGDHTRESTLRYFKKLKELAHNDSVIIVDDIYWSREMQSAWEKITADSDAIVTLDLFYFGLVFFRREQKKQHFKIRM